MRAWRRGAGAHPGGVVAWWGQRDGGRPRSSGWRPGCTHVPGCLHKVNESNPPALHALLISKTNREEGRGRGRRHQ